MRIGLMDRDNPALPTYYIPTQRMRGVYGVDTLFKKSIEDPVTLAISQVLIKNAKYMFNLSMRMVPLDTGLTAQSGRLMVAGRTVGRGVVISAEDGVTNAEYFFERGEKNILKAASSKQVNIRIGFRRLNEKGENIINAIHELGPLGSRHSKAKWPGRSGQFITYPFHQYERKLRYDIERAADLALGKIKFNPATTESPYVPESLHTKKGTIRKTKIADYKKTSPTNSTLSIRFNNKK